MTIILERLGTIFGRPSAETSEREKDPLATFLDCVNWGLEQTLGRSSFHQIEQRMIAQRLFAPTCQELDEVTRNTLTERRITSSFWDRILVFSSHEESFLPDKLSFVYDKNRHLFVLNFGNVLMNTQDIQILCHPPERLFKEQFVQVNFSVQKGEQRSSRPLKMLLETNQANKREKALFIVTRYQEGSPQISLSVLNLDSNWKELFDDNGKLKTALPANAQMASQGPNFEGLMPPAPGKLPLSAINEVLRGSRLIKVYEQIQSEGVSQPQVTYASDTQPIPVFIVARAEEIDPTKTISVSYENSADKTEHNLQIALHGIFLRCHREVITVAPARRERTAILLTLNPNPDVFMSTPEGGFYSAKKGIIAIPFELPHS